MLLYGRHDLPAHTAVVLLRPEADDPGLTGVVSYESPQGCGGLAFRYQVLRVWQRPAETFLAGGLGTIPLTPLSAVSQTRCPFGTPDGGAIEPRGAASGRSEVVGRDVLMGLRYPAQFAAQLLRAVRAMKESTTYQAILAEGRAEGQAVEARRSCCGKAASDLVRQTLRDSGIGTQRDDHVPQRPATPSHRSRRGLSGGVDPAGEGV